MSHLTEIMAVIRAEQIVRAVEAVAHDSFDETLEVVVSMQAELVWPLLERKLAEKGFTAAHYSAAPQVVRQYLIVANNPNQAQNRQRALSELCGLIERKLAIVIAKDPTKPHCIKYVTVPRKLRPDVALHFRQRGWQLYFDFAAGVSKIWLTRDAAWSESEPE